MCETFIKQQKISDENASPATRLNQNPANNTDRVTSTVSGQTEYPSNGVQNPSQYQVRQSVPQFFRLTTDCCDEIFDYLSLKEIHCFALTSTTMQKVSGVYFKRNFFANDRLDIGRYGIITKYADKNSEYSYFTEITMFNEFLTHLTHRHFNFGPLYYINSHIDQFSSLSHLTFYNVDSAEPKYEHISEILRKIESIKIEESSLVLCDPCMRIGVNLKRFSMKYCRIKGGRIKYTWLSRKYEKIEHLELIPSPTVETRIDELRDFFELNSSIRSFSTSSNFLWANRHLLLNSTVKLDILEIRIATIYDLYATMDQFGIIETRMQAICKLINDLYERKFYQRIHFYITLDEQITNIDELASLKGLEKLCISKFKEDYSLAPLMCVKELVIVEGLEYIDLDILAKKCTKLERLYFGDHTIEDILPFIRRSVGLKKIKAFHQTNGNFSIDIAYMNEERKKLTRTNAVIIYVPDNIFLQTKWTKNGDVNLSLVELRRGDSCEFIIE